MKPVRAMALQYVLLFAATGVALPFAGLWMASRGLDDTQIGVLMAVPMLARVVTGPLVAIWADSFALRRSAIGWLGLAGGVGYGLAAIGTSPWLIGLGWFLGAGAAGALIPLIDVLALRLSQRAGFAFSTTRGCGSAAFVAANLLMGSWLVRAPTEVVILWLTAVTGLLALAAWVTLPPEPVHLPDDPGIDASRRFAGLSDLLANPAFVLTIAAVGCVQAAHALYYAFSALDWAARGIAASTTGALWAFAVVIEIIFLWVIDPWRCRLGVGAWALLTIGAVAAVVRWTLMALSPSLPLLWGIQTLHALTFAATYLAGVELVARLSPPRSLTLAQTLNSVLSAGLLIGLATMVSGPLFAQWGAWAYLAMTALAAAGLILTGMAHRAAVATSTLNPDRVN